MQELVANISTSGYFEASSRLTTYILKIHLSVNYHILISHSTQTS